MDITTALELFGMNQNEIKIYLAVLEFGQATAQQLAKRTGIIRQTVYNIIDSLKEKSLVSETVISGVNNYSASNPDIFLKIEDERKSALNEVIPKLKESFSISKRMPKVQAFFGMKSIDKIYTDTLSSTTPIYWVEPDIISKNVMKEYKMENYIKKRIQAKIPLKMISDAHDKARKEMFKSDKKEMRETRFNESIKNFDASFLIYNNKVAIYSVKGDIIAIIIESEQIKDMFQKIFNLLWATK